MCAFSIFWDKKYTLRPKLTVFFSISLLINFQVANPTMYRQSNFFSFFLSIEVSKKHRQKQKFLVLPWRSNLPQNKEVQDSFEFFILLGIHKLRSEYRYTTVQINSQFYPPQWGGYNWPMAEPKIIIKCLNGLGGDGCFGHH